MLPYKVIGWAIGTLAGVAGVALAAEAFYAFAVPPRPLPLKTIQWTYEVGVTVDGVDRVASIGKGRMAIKAAGEFYIVHARVLAPYGLRPEWSDSDVEVQTFAGSGATRPPQRFTIDEKAQALLDLETGRPGPRHLVEGAQRHEDLVFDLPRDVEQPAVVFLPANDPAGVLSVFAMQFWRPHRFNIRYD